MSEWFAPRGTNGGPIGGPPKPIQTSLHYGMEGFKGDSQLGPNRMRVANHSGKEFSFSSPAYMHSEKPILLPDEKKGITPFSL